MRAIHFAADVRRRIRPAFLGYSSPYQRGGGQSLSEHINTKHAPVLLFCVSCWRSMCRVADGVHDPAASRRCGVFLPAQEVNALFRRFDARGDGHADAQVSVFRCAAALAVGVGAVELGAATAVGKGGGGGGVGSGRCVRFAREITALENCMGYTPLWCALSSPLLGSNSNVFGPLIPLVIPNCLVRPFMFRADFPTPTDPQKGELE